MRHRRVERLPRVKLAAPCTLHPEITLLTEGKLERREVGEGNGQALSVPLAPGLACR